MSAVTLPDGFDALVPLLDWNLPTMDARRARRVESSMAEIDAFYEALVPHMDQVLEHLAAVPMTADMDAGSQALLNMSLALCEVAPAVEQFREPTISYGYNPTRFAQGPQ